VAAKPYILEYYLGMKKMSGQPAFHYPFNRFHSVTREYELRPAHTCWKGLLQILRDTPEAKITIVDVIDQIMG